MAASVSAGLAVRPGGAPPSAYALIVLAVCDRVPPGLVVTYGDLAELAGRGTARTAGTVLSRHGHEVCWWRIVNAEGRPPQHRLSDALGRLRSEGCPVVGERVDLQRCRWDGLSYGRAALPR